MADGGTCDILNHRAVQCHTEPLLFTFLRLGQETDETKTGN